MPYYRADLKRHIGTALVVSAIAITLMPAQTFAQKLERKDILEKLVPKAKKPPSRGLTFGNNAVTQDASKLSEPDASYFGKLPNRGLSIRMKKHVAKIMDHAYLPSINIEISFGYDSAKIAPQSIPDLNTLGAALIDPRLANSRLLLNGHTDAVGSAAYNMDLSERRADAVRDYLISHFGISENRLIAIGFGEERLKLPNDPEAAANRRVEVVNVSG